MARDWSALGIVWVASEVSRQHGPNKTDRKTIGIGQVPQVENLDLAIEADLGQAIMAGVNGTSWRVTAQDVSRSYIEGTDKSKRDDEELRERIFTRLKGMRNAAIAVRETLVAPLPDGTSWSGTDAGDYESKYLEALVQGGVPEEVAIGIAARVALPIRQKLEK